MCRNLDQNSNFFRVLVKVLGVVPEGNEISYDFSKHEAGVYLIRIETAEGVATKRVVVTR